MVCVEETPEPVLRSDSVDADSNEDTVITEVYTTEESITEVDTIEEDTVTT